MPHAIYLLQAALDLNILGYDWLGGFEVGSSKNLVKETGAMCPTPCMLFGSLATGLVISKEQNEDLLNHRRYMKITWVHPRYSNAPLNTNPGCSACMG